MLTFYENNGFKLFPCSKTKEPKVKSWRASEAHLSIQEAKALIDSGEYIGAWLPRNFVVIDIDMNHRDKEGKEKPQGDKPFRELCESLNLPINLIDKTLSVKTGSGGFHLYFTVPENVDYAELSQRSIATSVDIRTHKGYVIPAGVVGYSVYTDAEVMELPIEILDILKTNSGEKAPAFIPEKQLSNETLKKVLDKIDVANFANNDDWQEFVTAIIATAGNAPETLDTIEEWCKGDSNYAEDESIRKRLETFVPSGGITAATFLHIMRKEDCSKYFISKVRMEIGAGFSLGSSVAGLSETPFKLDMGRMTDHLEQLKAFYYNSSQASGVELFCKMVHGSLIYSGEERVFYYFTGNYWQEIPGISSIIPRVLVEVAIKYYAEHSKGKDADSDEIVAGCINQITSLSTISKYEAAVKQNPIINKSDLFWDSSKLAGTLTLEDCVMDFSGKDIVFRPGRPEEYRRLFIDLKRGDFKEKEPPVKFKEFLKDIFLDGETRKTATYALSTMLSGSGIFRKFHIWNGCGANGKSTLIELMKSVIGERAISYNPNVLLSRSIVENLTPELAVFRGALAAFASETEESKKISQGVVKQMTGNETMTARPLYKGMIHFDTTFQAVLATNYLPSFSAHDTAFVSRLLILPFNTCFYKTKEDKQIGEMRGAKCFIASKNPDKLKTEILEERASILYYLAMRYQELDGVIPESEECRRAKSAYIDANSDFEDFCRDFIECDPEPTNGIEYYFTPSKDLIDFFNAENGTKYSAKWLTMRLKEVYPIIELHSKKISGKLTRGMKHIRLVHGAYIDGYQKNYSKEEIENYQKKEEVEREASERARFSANF